jgi:tryptophanyl-tRNA synthetase
LRKKIYDLTLILLLKGKLVNNTASSIAGEDNNEMVVTPWEVKGKVDYERLIREFGTQPLTTELLGKVEKHTGKLHLQLERKIFFSHRDLDTVLDLYDKGVKFVLYTGRGPSGPVHIGHLVPWIFTLHIQQKFGSRLYFQLTDDEKFLIDDNANLKETRKYAYENALDLIALGFKPENTFIIYDTEDIDLLYDITLEVAKRITYSTARSSFGFQDSTNIGWVFWPAIQAAPCFIHKKLTGENVPALIPAAIDQDPYWRVTRDIAQKLGCRRKNERFSARNKHIHHGPARRCEEKDLERLHRRQRHRSRTTQNRR